MLPRSLFRSEEDRRGGFLDFQCGNAWILFRITSYNVCYTKLLRIAEKTGPHFAVGDTCYHMSEDHKVYNRDGKEIVARDNEVSILRKTEIEKAYYNCHTVV